MGVPPERAIFVLGAGDEVRDDVRDVVRTFGKSEISEPAAEGGGFGVEEVEVTEGG